MANYSRSRKGDLYEGATDGRYKKLRPDTVDVDGGNTTETMKSRKHLNLYNHGQFVEASQMDVPGSPCSC